jgi:hypothetical protein
MDSPKLGLFGTAGLGAQRDCFCTTNGTDRTKESMEFLFYWCDW